VAATGALMGANARFWPLVLPDVRRELRGWERRARAIPAGALRAQALAKLRGERFNAEVAATLATLAAPSRRHATVEAIVALEVMYDYLDGLGEQPVPDPLANGRELYAAFADAFAPAGPPRDHCRHQPRRDDGGYLAALALACRHGLWALPAAPAVAPVAAAVAARCGEAQTRTHATRRLGPGQLRRWAQAQPETTAGSLGWPEVAAGAAASVLAVHALIAAAADPSTTAADARRIAAAYLPTSALTTLLDSFVDADADRASGSHAFLAYYGSDAEVAERLGALARLAVAGARELPHAPHHLTTVAGAVAFYLSDPALDSARGRRLTAEMAGELRPLLTPTLAIFRAWRRAKRFPRAGAGVPAAPAEATARRAAAPALA